MRIYRTTKDLPCWVAMAVALLTIIEEAFCLLTLGRWNLDFDTFFLLLWGLRKADNED